MLKHDELVRLYAQFALPASTQAVVNTIRAAPPSRLVRAAAGNVTVRYSSRKMGQVIQAESHRNELAFIYLLEHDPLVLEYYDQPPPLKLNYQRSDGRQASPRYTPDFFVIRQDKLGWVECKTEQELEKLEIKDSNRYIRDKAGRWCCPPGQTYAQALGLTFQVWSSAQVDWVYLHNLHFLEDFLGLNRPNVNTEATLEIQRLVRARPAITLKEVLDSLVAAKPDDVYSLIAQEQIYFDMYSARLSESPQVRLYPDPQTAFESKKLRSIDNNDTFNRVTGEAAAVEKGLDLPRPALIQVVAGASLLWDGKAWLIINIGDTTISLLSSTPGTGEQQPELVELPNGLFEQLIRQGKVQGNFDQSSATEKGSDSATNPSTGDVIKELITGAAPKDLSEANRRAGIVRSLLQKEQTLAELVVTHKAGKRTIWRWVAAFRQAEQKYGLGNGYLGLLPDIRGRGNRQQRLSPATLDLMREFVEQVYETPKQRRIYAVWGALLVKCQEQGLVAPGYKTFVQAVRSRPLYEQKRKREGERAAYVHQAFYWQLEYTTPRHGDYPFQICHIDHTELDLELKHSTTGENMGRPWVTFLSDAYSRRILAFYLTYDPPSYRSCMMVLRECVQRHGRLPQTLVADGGREFHSLYFETLLARYECHLKTRPAVQPRFGSICERLFGTTNTRFIYNLEGNTQLTKRVRVVTAQVNPKKLAVWELESFYRHLYQWAYQEYETIRHPALGRSPREAFTSGLLESGRRLSRFIPYDADFIFSTLPTTARGTARVQVNYGIKLNHIYYWSNEFQDPQIERSQVPVRYDPFNAGIAYAYVKGKWVECLAELYSVFKGRSEREIKQATVELRQQQRQTDQNASITAYQLAVFLNSVEAEEQLAKQRQRDGEAKKIGAGGDSTQVNVATKLPAPVTNSANQEEFYSTSNPTSGDSPMSSETPISQKEASSILTDSTLQPKRKGRKARPVSTSAKAAPQNLTTYEDY